MKTKETNLHAVNDRSMMDWLANEEFNTMTGSGSGSGSGCGCGCGSGSWSDNWQHVDSYVCAGEDTTTVGSPISFTLRLSWTAGTTTVDCSSRIWMDILGYNIDTTEEYLYLIPSSVNIHVRWQGLYSMNIWGSYQYRKKRYSSDAITASIIGGYSVPERYRKREE